MLIATVFNDYFAEVFIKEDLSNLPSVSKSVACEFKDIVITEDLVINALKLIKDNKAGSVVGSRHYPVDERRQMRFDDAHLDRRRQHRQQAAAERCHPDLAVLAT